MKRILFSVLCLILIVSMCTPAFAAEKSHVILTQEIDLGNGITMIDELIDLTTARASDRTYARTLTIKDNDDTIGVITIIGIFRYDGTSVSVVSKVVDQTDTYYGWNYVQNSFTENGGTITLDAKLTKLLVFNIPFTISITCDANGKIS